MIDTFEGEGALHIRNELSIVKNKPVSVKIGNL